MSHEMVSTLPRQANMITLTRPAKVVLLLGAVLAALVFVFMTIDSRGNWDFIIPFRGTKLLALFLVGYAIAFSTVVFQTVVNNRILTPSVMGFDTMYMVIQTGLIFTVGSVRLVNIDPRLRFLLEITIMMLFAGLLYRNLFGKYRRSLHLLILVGIILGTFFRSITGLMTRLLDPNEYAILQDLMFASFNSFDRELLGISAVLIALATVVAWRMWHVLDVLTLGRETAINLGVDYQRSVSILLVVITIMVSVSTALVGPVMFFGLLVANLAYILCGTYKHRWVIPTAVLLALVFLVGGQMLVERLFSFTTSLSIITEFVGGITFIILLLRGIAR